MENLNIGSISIETMNWNFRDSQQNDFKQLKGCSLITASYRNKQNVLGSIGVVGPTSMDYRRIISMVDYTAKILTKIISEQSYD